MKLQIERPHVEALIARFPELAALDEQLRFANKAEIPFQQLSMEQLQCLGALYADAGPSMQGKAAQIATLRHALSDEGATFAEGELEKMVPAIAEYLLRDAIRGWLFRANSSGRLNGLVM